MLSQLCGQSTAKGILRGALERGRIAHAYLFAGPDGSGKSVAAREVASALLGAPAEGQADFHEIAPEKQSFKIEQVRELTRLASLRPYGGGRAVFVLKRVESLTPDAAAALLKTVEEPPGPSVFLLLCEHVAQVEPTLRSRCQLVPFGPVPPLELAAWLVARGVPEEEAQDLASLSGGIPGRALALAEDAAWRERRARAQALVDEVGSGGIVDELERARAAAEGEELLDPFGLALRDRLVRGGGGGWSVDALLSALTAWADAQSAQAANVGRRLNWEILLLRLRYFHQLRYDEA